MTLSPNYFTVLAVQLAALSVLLLLDIVQGRVNIILEYSPPYMQAGRTMSLVCNSVEGLDLEWSYVTIGTNNTFTPIKPRLGGQFVIRKLKEHPSNYAESTLIKKDLSLADTGSYQCEDTHKVSTFSVYVTVLQILKEDVTVAGTVAAGDMASVTLTCDIIGFRTNIPEMGYMWLYKGMRIPESSHYKYSTSQSETWDRVTLTIRELGSQDTGNYTCVFIFKISFGRPFNATENVFLDAKQLPVTSAGSHTLYLTVIIVVTCLASLWLGPR